jgi:hypothetical protein
MVLEDAIAIIRKGCDPDYDEMDNLDRIEAASCVLLEAYETLLDSYNKP